MDKPELPPGKVASALKRLSSGVLFRKEHPLQEILSGLLRAFGVSL